MRFSYLLRSCFIITAAVTATMFFTGCTKSDEDKGAFTDSEFSYVTFVGSVIKPENDAAVNTWYNETHIPMLWPYAGLKKAVRFKGASPVDTALPKYWTMYHYANKTDMDGLGASAEFTAAIGDMTTRWANGEFTTTVAISYQKLKSFEKEGVDVETSVATIVGVEMDAASEAAINDWYNTTHIPMLMEYEGIVKAVRYKKVSAQISPDALPTYVIVYYYSSKKAQDDNPTHKSFTDAMADAETKWGTKLVVKFPYFAERLFIKTR